MAVSNFPEGEGTRPIHAAMGVAAVPVVPVVPAVAQAATSQADAPVVEKMVPQVEVLVPVDQRINAAFHIDELARGVLTDNLKKRSEVSQRISERSKAAFAGFDPSRLSREERMKASYLSPGDNVMSAMKATMQERVDQVQASGGGKLRLALTDKLKAALKQDPGNSDTMSVEPLMTYVTSTLLTSLVGPITLKPTISICEAEIEAKRRMAQIQGAPSQTPAVDSPPAIGSTHPVSTSPNGDGNGRAAALVDSEVGRQMGTATSPESQLRYSVDKRSDPDGRRQALDTFELRDGPSDVTSYHDFSTLHIAFPHVWHELFDGQFEALGTEIYSWWVKLKQFAGTDNQADKPITSLEDIKELLRDVRELSQTIVTNTPAGSQQQIPGWILMLMPWLKETADAAQKQKDTEAGKKEEDVLGDNTRLKKLLDRMEALLGEAYAFHVFAKDSINFGFIVTYRQKWEPISYQVGDLVSTIPLAPREIRRYTTRKVSKKTRAVKELQDNLITRRTESSDTNRVEREIVEKAQQKSNFTLTAHESYGKDGFSIDATQNQFGEQSKESARTKKEFRESVVKAAQEYKQQHRMEIDTSESTETEDTGFHEIQNPNDELTVTYMFYELQRRYRISERIHKITPVVLVANDVPAPNEIDDAWLLKQDWILRRVILDDSFRPALRYLTESFIGAELNIRLLRENASAQQSVVETLRQQVSAQNRVLDAAEAAVQNKVQGVADAQKTQGLVDVVKGFFDPLQITKSDPGFASAAEAMADLAKETRDRAERERARLAAQLEVAITALQAAIDKLSAAIREHYDKVAEIDRLRVHVKDNILYYMQAIWSHEPPDQRYFRTYHLDVPDLKMNTAGALVGMEKLDNDYFAVLRSLEGVFGSLPLPVTQIVPTKKLVQVADLDTVLGYKGNYSIYPLIENNYLTLHMMQDYLEVGDELVLRDPDEAGEYTLEELQELATCLYRRDRTGFEKNKDKIEKMLLDRLTDPRKDHEDIVVPTTSLYLEALVGTHPLLEDFKLIHRALDVKKVQAEVRHAELENVRLAARALRGKDEDPDIERKIVVESTAAPQWTLQPDNN